MTATTRAARPRILLVDDAEDLRSLYEAALESEGYETRAVASAESALELLRDWRPDLVLTDISMPGMGGFELITRIRSDFAPPVPRVVAVSGFPDAKEEALRRGAFCFELKPVMLDRLFDVAARTLDSDASPEALVDEDDEELEARRRNLRALGTSLVDVYFNRFPDAPKRLERGARALRRFFGHSTVITLLLRSGELRVCASSDPARVPLGGDPTELLSLCNDVLESGASLILPDRRAQALFGRNSTWIRFLACVPFVVGGMAVGVSVIVGDEPHELSSAELRILEYLASRWTALLSNPLAEPAHHMPSDLVGRDAFEFIMDCTIEWATKRGSSYGLTLIGLEKPLVEKTLEGIPELLPFSRMLATHIGRRKLAVFVAANEIAHVRDILEQTRRATARRLGIHASSELAFSDPAPMLRTDVLLKWGDDLLLRASANGQGECIRISAQP